jgi:hypothetical protein
MLQTQFLLKHIDALLRLSHDVKDRTVSAELRAMADEFRIMVSVADVTRFAAELSKGSAAAPSGLGSAGAVPSKMPSPARKDAEDQALRFSQARHARLDRALVCTRAGAP